MTSDLLTMTLCGVSEDYADHYIAALSSALDSLPRPSRGTRVAERAAPLRLWSQLDRIRSQATRARGLLNPGESFICFEDEGLTVILRDGSPSHLNRDRCALIIAHSRELLSISGDVACYTVTIREAGYWFSGDEEITPWSDGASE